MVSFMTDTQNIQWKRIGIEAAAIVASILLAFAIDAWWEDHKEAASRSSQLQSLVREFEEAHRHLSQEKRGLEGSLAGTIKILEMMGPDASSQDSQLLSKALVKSLDVGVSRPQQGVLKNVLASRDSLSADSTELWSALQSWSTNLNVLALDGNHLEQNREQYFITALIRLEVSMTAIFPENSPLALPASKFETDLSKLLRDPGVVTVFASRALRTRLLLAGYEDAIHVATEIIEQLEDEQ
jgi:hypothetical protein